MSIYIPSELFNIIFNFIDNTETYLSCRLVCKRWYDLLFIIYIFKNNVLIEKVYFKENEIIFKNLNNNIIARCLFKKYGYYQYISYDIGNTNKITSSPFQLKKEIMNYTYNEKINYNILTDDKNKFIQNLPGCCLM